MATLGMTTAEREAVEAFRRDVVEPSMTSLVIIDFWAEWCGPCKMIAPIIEEIGEEYKDRVVVGKINVDDNDDATSKYGIRNIPTVLFIKNGKVMEKMVGAASKKMFVEKIERLL